MDKSEIVVEIPPPEDSPVEASRWGFIVVSVAMVAVVVVFVLATTPRMPAFEWQQVTGPSPVNLDSIVATSEVFAMLSGMTVDGVLLWWSDDGVEWGSRPLRTTRTQLAAVDDGLFAHDDSEGHMLHLGDGEWMETEEDIALPDEIRSRQSSGRASVVGTDPGMLTMSIVGDVWWTPDQADFELVVSEPEWGSGAEVGQIGQLFESDCDPPTRSSPDVPPVLVTDDGLFALISSNPSEPFGIWPVCEPDVWASDDGAEWSRGGPLIGDGAYVYDVGWRQGRFIAVGGYGIGRPAAWSSADGHTWESLPFFVEDGELDLYTLAAGPAGWVVLGQTGEESTPVGWTSSDGECWERLPWEVAGTDAAVGRDGVLVLDRTSYPELWLGSVTGGTGSC